MNSRRNRTPSEYIGYALYFYFSGLSLRRTSERLACFIRRNHVSIWNWIQKYKPQRISSKKKNIEEYVLDETIIKAGSEYIWLWVAIMPKNKEILGISISKERNMFVAERFLSKIVEKCGDHPVSTDGGTWYPQACKFLNMDHHIHSQFEKSIVERTIQYIKDRTECFDDYFPCRKKKCKLKHLINWLNLFKDFHNKELCLK
ncbi:MAG TPA: DDE-type integrase/transposase/recombinase [Candidatus Nitrosopolaris sp.]|nr:DDE-type integrase/transposase/recombinase [Candidatus Nitrosopolaris sp.]